MAVFRTDACLVFFQQKSALVSDHNVGRPLRQPETNNARTHFRSQLPILRVHSLSAARLALPIMGVSPSAIGSSSEPSFETLMRGMNIILQLGCQVYLSVSGLSLSVCAAVRIDRTPSQQPLNKRQNSGSPNIFPEKLSLQSQSQSQSVSVSVPQLAG